MHKKTAAGSAPHGGQNGPKMTRRAVVAGMAMATALPKISWAGSSEGATLRAAAFSQQILPQEYPQTPVWGFNGSSPGPQLRVMQGARFRQTLRNDLDQATSVHWHGLRIDNAMDGVPDLTQAAVQPGQGFDYDFTVPDAGTFWYHSHNRSTEQVARGLLGALIVDEPQAPDIDRDQVLVLDDWLLQRDGTIAGDFDAPHARAHAGRIGNVVTTNGAFDFTRSVRRADRLRLRLINASNARVFTLGLYGLEGWVMALDGMPLAAPQAVGDALTLGPGQRADLFVDVTADEGQEAYLTRLEPKAPAVQARFTVAGRAGATRRGAPVPLPPNRKPVLAPLDQVERVVLNLQGGAMGSLQSAVLDGKTQSFDQMLEANQFWSINQIVGLTDTPFLDLARGQTQRIEMRNDTAFPHAIHLHGMHFQEISAAGTAGPLRDTVFLNRGETREIAFVADNPGNWLFHCHMLSHAASGMTTWIRVTA